jgi:hypothetical protein
MSVNTLQRMFRSVHGTTVFDYVRARKLHRGAGSARAGRHVRGASRLYRRVYQRCEFRDRVPPFFRDHAGERPAPASNIEPGLPHPCGSKLRSSTGTWPRSRTLIPIVPSRVVPCVHSQRVSLRSCSSPGGVSPLRRTIPIDHRDRPGMLLKPRGRATPARTPAGRRRSGIGNRGQVTCHQGSTRTWESEVSKTRNSTERCASAATARLSRRPRIPPPGPDA